MTCPACSRSGQRCPVFAGYQFASGTSIYHSAIRLERYGYLLALIQNLYYRQTVRRYRCRCIGTRFKAGIVFKRYGSIRAGCTRYIIRVGRCGRILIIINILLVVFYLIGRICTCRPLRIERHIAGYRVSCKVPRFPCRTGFIFIPAGYSKPLFFRPRVGSRNCHAVQRSLRHSGSTVRIGASICIKGYRVPFHDLIINRLYRCCRKAFTVRVILQLVGFFTGAV